MHSKIKVKFYILILLILLTFVLGKYYYSSIYKKNASLKKSIKKNEQMIQKVRKKKNELKNIKNTLKISSNKLKRIKLSLFKGKEATDTLENFQKYIFEYFTNKGVEISDYRQMPLKEKKYFYLCRIELNFKASTKKILEIFNYFSKSNYMITIDNFNIYYINSRIKKLRARFVFNTFYFVPVPINLLEKINLYQKEV